MKTPFLLLLDGMTGSGKSTVAKLLSEKIPRLAHIGLDQVKLNISDYERGDRDNDIGRDIVLAMTKIYLSNGISVVIDQPIKTAEIEKFEEISNAYSAQLHKVQFFLSPEVAFERIIERMKTWEKPTSEEQVKKNIAFFKSKKDLGFIQFDKTHTTSEEAAEEILKLLNQ
jgi:adenylate kinase family enzyme